MKKSLFVLIVFLLIFNCVFPNKNADKEKFRKELSKLDKKIQNIQKEKDSILNQIYKIELKYEKVLINKRKINYDLRDISEQIKIKLNEQKSLKRKIYRTKDKIKKILRVLYKQGSNKHIRVFLNTKNINRLFKNYKFFEALISYNNKEIVSFRKSIEKLLKVRKELLQKNEQKLKAKQEIEKNILQLKAIKSNKLSLISKINNDRIKYIKLRDELKQEFSKFKDKIIDKVRIVELNSDIEIDKLKGKLIWPVKGKIITQFGKQKSTKFDTYVINTGIEIKPKTSQKRIKSIYSGNVVFADYWKGYGKLIVIQHSKNFLSFYGHCEKFLKKNGSFVNNGEDIAIIGDTGSANIKSLYFEIRKSLVAQDPIKWLKRK